MPGETVNHYTAHNLICLQAVICLTHKNLWVNVYIIERGVCTVVWLPWTFTHYFM